MLLFGLAAIEQQVFPGAAPALEDSLILDVAKGDTRAFSELYIRTHKSIYGFALSIVKNQQDAEDVMQDTYLKVDRAAGSYQPRGKPMAWLLTIARNLALERLRSRRDVPLETGTSGPQRTPLRRRRTLWCWRPPWSCWAMRSGRW